MNRLPYIGCRVDGVWANRWRQDRECPFIPGRARGPIFHQKTACANVKQKQNRFLRLYYALRAANFSLTVKKLGERIQG